MSWQSLPDLSTSRGDPRSSDILTNISDVYSLSPVQQGLLFHSLYEPDSAAYFNQLGCRIEGALDLNVLRQAVDEVARRHAILRTGFYWQNLKQPLQAVYESVEVPWAVEDWSDIPTEERERKWTGFLAADRLRGFDLSKPPCFASPFLDWAIGTATFAGATTTSSWMAGAARS